MRGFSWHRLALPVVGCVGFVQPAVSHCMVPGHDPGWPPTAPHPRPPRIAAPAVLLGFDCQALLQPFRRLQLRTILVSLTGRDLGRRGLFVQDWELLTSVVRVVVNQTQLWSY